MTTKAVTDVVAERERQVFAEGWTAEHDDSCVSNELVQAAHDYITHVIERSWMHAIPTDESKADYRADEAPDDWPWAETEWKPKDPRRDLVRAAALIIAEIERLDRASKADISESK